MQESTTSRTRWNDFVSGAMIVVSLTALAAVASGFLLPPQADEGAAAHIFQLSVAGFALLLPIFLATSDRVRPSQPARKLVVPGALMSAAFVLLYCLEHLR